MVGQNWLLQTLSDVFNRYEATGESAGKYQPPKLRTDAHLNQVASQRWRLAKLKAQREWFGAIAALETLLLPIGETAPRENEQCPGLQYCSDQTDLTPLTQGLLLSGPTAIVSHADLIAHLQTGIFRPEAFKNLALLPFQLPAAEESHLPVATSCPVVELPLLPNDPIATEQFCLAFTPQFAVAIVSGYDAKGLPALQFSFDPELIQQCWATLRSRLLLTNPYQLQRLDPLVEQFTPSNPDYRLVTQFSRQLLQALPEAAAAISPVPPEQTGVKVISLAERREKPQPPPSGAGNLSEQKRRSSNSGGDRPPEVELLQALTHEIRTPLTTIRTLTKLLLRRCELKPDALKLLETIDQECSEQINRMELIFRATELGTKPFQQRQVPLTPVSLDHLLQQSIPRWKKQAQRRNVLLDVILPQKLPQVVSDPAMLDQALTGLLEKFTRSLPTGGKIQVQVTTAGNQLKLQLLSQCSHAANPLKSLGQLLTFQPETGSLSLNLDVTKNLFHALGGKLIVRQRPQQGEVLTVFLPLGNAAGENYASKLP